MSTQELQQRTAVNIQEKANLIWAIADKLVGTYKPHEYGQVILTSLRYPSRDLVMQCTILTATDILICEYSIHK